MNRKIQPAFTQPNKLEIQFPQQIELQNGVQLFWLNDVKDASVKLDMEWCAGSKYQHKKLSANFTNKLILSGNEAKLGSEIAEEIDFHGGYLQHEMDRDHAGVTLYGLIDNIRDIFAVFEEAFMSCTFPDLEFEKERSVSLMRFKIDAQKVKTVCSRKFTQEIFSADSAYGQLATAADFEAIQREDVIGFYNEFYMSANLSIFLVGNVDQAFINDLNAWSGKLQPKAIKFEPTGISQAKGRIDEVVPNALQTAIRFGRLFVDKNHKDYFKFQLLNTAFGGYFGSRLMTNIREDKGYTYGIGSAVSVMENAAQFYISTEVGVDVKEATIKEILSEMNRLRSELIPEDELARVKNYMLGDFLRHADGSIAMMENYKNIHFNRLKKTYYSDFIRAIHEATAEDLLEIANRYFNPADYLIVTAG